MKIKKIIGEHEAMPQLCKGGSCPAAIIADDGNAYIQGFQLEETERTTLTAPHGEGFVRMPLAVFRKIAAQVVTK